MEIDMDTLKLGQIITTEQHRDAIHVAVAPVIARQLFKPGEHAGADGYYVNPVGIVDPFLTASVDIGQTFWLFLYPGSITSLRHNWSHPAFADDFGVTPETPNRSASEVWMRAWAMEHVSRDYYGDGESIGEDAAFAFAIRAGEENHIGPYEDARDYISDEWWGHWEAITGKRGNRGEYFSCSC